MFCEIPVFGRCCFCLPLRRGVLTFGYLNILFAMFMVGIYSYAIHQPPNHLFAAFMVGIYSYAVHHDYALTMVFHGVAGDVDNWMCLVIYLADVIFSAILLYGAHRQITIYIRAFYYYALCTLVAVVILEIIVGSQRPFFLELELLPMFVIGLSIHVYLIFLVRSLLKKLDMSGHTYENQLHQIVNGEIVKGPSTVYPSTVVPLENA